MSSFLLSTANQQEISAWTVRWGWSPALQQDGDSNGDKRTDTAGQGREDGRAPALGTWSSP